jgi:dTDP-4-dehydrorhamnose reductase
MKSTGENMSSEIDGFYSPVGPSIRVLILGKDGMLGSMVAKVLSENKSLEVIAVGRDEVDAKMDMQEKIETYKADWIINCIGIIKPYISENAEEAIRVNSLFPHVLAKVSAKVIQIATDCVFSGDVGDYLEDEEHDALDTYGKTKSLGEVKRHGFYNVRCSIIGPQVGNPSLLQWFLDLPKQSEVKGFVNHYWNGITTEAFANVCVGIIKTNPEITNFHIIPRDQVSKYELLKMFAEIFDRKDVLIEKQESIDCDRTLGTIHPEFVKEIWQKSGYEEVPTIQDLLNDLKKHI